MGVRILQSLSYNFKHNILGNELYTIQHQSKNFCHTSILFSRMCNKVDEDIMPINIIS